MIVGIVEIVLKDEKKEEFKTWITESNKTLSKFDGFISRRLLEAQNGGNRIMVEFQDMESFQKMHSSPEHSQFARQLPEFMAQPPQRNFFQVVAE
tara:strand:- start:1821 stop:2105 length:285 start_codon:yes stop_codon:yes gene_type:complete